MIVWIAVGVDIAVEGIELELCKRVAQGADGDFEKFPIHVNQKIDERLQKAAKKSAAFDHDLYETLDGKLEYCDL